MVHYRHQEVCNGSSYANGPDASGNEYSQKVFCKLCCTTGQALIRNVAVFRVSKESGILKTDILSLTILASLKYKRMLCVSFSFLQRSDVGKTSKTEISNIHNKKVPFSFKSPWRTDQ